MSCDELNIEIPDFEPYIRNPKNIKCKRIDTKNIIAEILGGEFPAVREIQDSFKGSNTLIEGEHAILLRYKREKDGKTYPAIVMGYDINDNNEVIIRHIQGTKEKRVAYRFTAGFNSIGFFVNVIRENFTKKGLKISLPDVPTNLEGASYSARSPEMYESLKCKLENLNAELD